MRRPTVDVDRLLVHPVIVVAIGIWAINDHVLKHQMPGVLTGKLSDVACLVALPALGLGTTSLLRLPATRTQLVGWAIVFAGIMAAINVWVPAAAGYRTAFGSFYGFVDAVAELARGEPPVFRLAPAALTMDLTDLATLPAAAVAPWLMKSTRGLARGSSTANHQAASRYLAGSAVNRCRHPAQQK